MEENQARAEQAYRKAVQYELDYGCCPQCVLAAVQETAGIVDDGTIKASHGLSGGGGLTAQGACSALTGGLLALSATSSIKAAVSIISEKTKSLWNDFARSSVASPAWNCRNSLSAAPMICGMPTNTRHSTRRAGIDALTRPARLPSGNKNIIGTPEVHTMASILRSKKPNGSIYRTPGCRSFSCFQSASR